MQLHHLSSSIGFLLGLNQILMSSSVEFYCDAKRFWAHQLDSCVSYTKQQVSLVLIALYNPSQTMCTITQWECRTVRWCIPALALALAFGGIMDQSELFTGSLSRWERRVAETSKSDLTWKSLAKAKQMIDEPTHKRQAEHCWIQVKSRIRLASHARWSCR